jgi:WD40 repeat protein
MAPAERPGIEGWTYRTGEIQYLRFSPDDRYLAAIVRQPDDRITRELLVVDTRVQAPLLMVEDRWPSHLCFSQTADRLAVMWYGKIAVYDIPSGTLILEVPRPMLSRAHRAIGFSPDGEQLVQRSTVDLGQTIHDVAWDIDTGKSTAEYEVPRLWDGLEQGILLSPDGSTFTSGGWPGPTPRVRRLDDAEFYTYCYYFPWPIFRDFTPDSQSLITLHEDGALFLWELRHTGYENARILRSEADTGLQSAKTWALLSTSERIAYIDAQDRLRFRRLFTGPEVTDPNKSKQE